MPNLEILIKPRSMYCLSKIFLKEVKNNYPAETSYKIILDLMYHKEKINGNEVKMLIKAIEFGNPSVYWYMNDRKGFYYRIDFINKMILNYKPKPFYFGLLFRPQSFWIGLHYSKECKRYCLNIIPCFTIWWTKRGGLPVDKSKM